MWYQRSRAKWLTDGNCNTKYYHMKTIYRRRRNKIVTLKNDQGLWVEDESDLKGLVNDYYQNLFELRSPWCTWIETGITFPMLEAKDLQVMSRSLEDTEVKEAVFSMSPSKAPDPDGFPVSFYQKSWNMIGSKVCHIIMHISQTDIYLIPKVEHPQMVSQFRPMSLCNAAYKVVVSNVIVNRLKGCLTKIVSPFQT